MGPRVCRLVALVAVVSSFLVGGSFGDQEELANTVKFLQEQVSALLEHRQEDYNALEESLKRSVEKNTELVVLKNEIKQLRKEISSLRASGGSSASPVSGPLVAGPATNNEAKNDRLRLRWLGSAVAELQAELAELLRTRNMSEELAERSRLRSEIELLRSDVAGVGRGVRDLGARLDELESSLGAVGSDLAASKQRTSQLSVAFADATSQLSSVQMEVKSIKEEGKRHISHPRGGIPVDSENDVNPEKSPPEEVSRHHTRHALSRLPGAVHRLDERLDKLEHKIGLVSRKRALLEKRVVFEDRADGQQLSQRLSDEVHRLHRHLATATGFGESVVRLVESMERLEERVVANQSETRRELGRLGVNVALKAAELSASREDLANLKDVVQALSVSAVRLQGRSDQQQEALARLNASVDQLVEFSGGIGKAENLTKELEHVEDDYRKMVDALPGNCEERDGLSLLAPGPGAPLLAACRKGWIVVGRRVDGSVDFDRSWNDYATGFGSPLNEFWAGNEALHRLSRDNCTRLRIELYDIDDNYWLATYENFSVDGEENGYRLRVSGFGGNATDAMSYQNDMRFSARDRDLDASTTNCAANYHGGWWFSKCQHANLNGRYSLGLTWYRSDSNKWMAIASAELAVQRKEQCL
ncbi:protein scabrous-like [Copidosoma floridanum]|uniref:protein scabrous-like n=1 Tax=Copidosoma floridanum TaxID=29053 RepID=UPI000C6F6035|nr:protein scabrous-like [Copidosoma floridanum]